MNKKYLTTLNTRPFLYRETKMIAELIDQGLNDEEIKIKVLDENIFQIKSVDRRKRFYSEIQKRLDELDEYLLGKLLNSDTSTSKAILLYAILKRDILFYEWMREVVWDKLLTLNYDLTKYDTELFFAKKSEQSDQVRSWGNNTITRLTNAYHQTLVEAEIAIRVDTNLSLNRPIISSQVEQYLKTEKERQIVEVLLGEVIE
ncbi:Putative inner membrane protein [Alkalibacterium gilvum]|uniref:Putative inner membrane protein n=1 Tax=Alkalibacterium gilvum TaxID=1130080 RepID=A0A1H6SF29_9LACT|nr:DUF1819 family protein [Alkalibacterium gilvum]SEI62630.1 Putative inner membrane protein [Alkalibacterium gilvum]